MATATACASGGTADSGGGREFLIGNIAGITGSFAASIAGVEPVIDSWTRWVNESGGINGANVRVVVEDDAAVPATGIAAARSLIQERKVLAIVGPASNTISAWYGLATKAGVPVIGGQVNGGPLFLSEPLLFPTGTTDAAGPPLDMAIKEGKTKLAVLYCSEVPVCAQTGSQIQDDVGRVGHGLQQVYRVSISGSAPNYTSQCLAAQQAGADAMVIATGAAVSVRVGKDCASQGYTPRILGIGAQADHTFLEDPIFEGTPFYQPNVPWFDTESKVGSEMNAAIQKYHPDLLKQPTYNPNVAQVWAALETFRAAMVQARVDPVTATPQTVIDALYTLPAGFTANGATPPITYVKGKPTPQISCYFLVRVKGGKWVRDDGGQAICPTG